MQGIEALDELQLAPAVTYSPVCQSCQRRLNEVFETPAHPLLEKMLSGEEIELSILDQVVLTAWFIKTDILLALFRTARGSEFTLGRWDEPLRKILLSMMSDGLPPENSSVRVGLFEARREPLTIIRRYVPFEVIAEPRFSYWVTSVHVLGHIVSETVIGLSEEARGDFFFLARDDRRLLFLWPKFIPQKLRWPPILRLGGEAGEALRAEWNHHAKNRVGHILKPETQTWTQVIPLEPKEQDLASGVALWVAKPRHEWPPRTLKSD